jgi:hypothetical protein
MNGATYVEKSENSKLGKMDAVYTSIKSTCPDTCELKDKGCYAALSFVGIVSRRLDKEARKLSPLQVARAEARAIIESYRGGKVPEGTVLRLHVSGDSRTLAGTRIIDKAVGKWLARGGRVGYSYTHAWRHVPRKTWRNTSVLASVDSIDQVEAARSQGYAPAMVVPTHISDKAYVLAGSDTKWIPCPNQTRGITCNKCGLCFNADRLHDSNMGIAFAAHGSKQKEVKRRLTVIK